MASDQAAATLVNRRPDVHDSERRITRAEERLQRGDTGIPPAAARAILGFVSSKRGAVSPLRLLGYLERLPNAAKGLGPDFLSPGPKTPAKFFRMLEQKETWTQITMRSVLYSFWKWKFGDLPAGVRIEISRRNTNHKGREHVLEPAEVTQLADHAVNLRDKALIWTLYESGARIGEILSLTIGDVERTDYGAVKLYLPGGKTGRRTVPLFEAAVPNLLLWLKQHPHRDDKGACLWCTIQQGKRRGEPITYRMAVKVLESAAKRAGITKPVNPHNFRHSRATVVAQDPRISTSVLEKFFGWEPGSPMAKTYVHLSGKEVEEAIARAHGIEIGKVDAPKTALPRVCARCSTPNDSGGKFCIQCGGPLSLEGVEERARWKAEEDALADLLDDPKVRAFIARRLKARLARPTA